MKKAILILLMLLFSSFTCFAEEITFADDIDYIEDEISAYTVDELNEIGTVNYEESVKTTSEEDVSEETIPSDASDDVKNILDEVSEDTDVVAETGTEESVESIEADLEIKEIEKLKEKEEFQEDNTLNKISIREIDLPIEDNSNEAAVTGSVLGVIVILLKKKFKKK